MKRIIISATLLAVALSIFTIHAEEKAMEQKIKKQTTCPVMKGNPINEKLYVDVEGKRIYICCKGCIDPIKADPKKYIKQLEAEGITLEAAPVPQTNCPVMTKNPIDKKLFVEAEGKRIYVCCNACIATVKADPKKYIKQLEAQGITVEKVIKEQTHCPVMTDNPISKDLYVDAEGKRIYVCCNACVKPVKEDPAKYIKQLEDQGITLAESPKKGSVKNSMKRMDEFPSRSMRM